MNNFLLGYIVSELYKDAVTGTPVGVPKFPMPVKLAKLFKKYKISDMLWVYFLGVFIGLLPLMIFLFLWVVADII